MRFLNYIKEYDLSLIQKKINFKMSTEFDKKSQNTKKEMIKDIPEVSNINDPKVMNGSDEEKSHADKN